MPLCWGKNGTVTIFTQNFLLTSTITKKQQVTD